jgi:hypothetical protein
MEVVFDTEDGEPFRTMPADALGKFLLKCADRVKLDKYRRHPSGLASLTRYTCPPRVF